MEDLKFKDKFIVWTGIVLSYVFTFFTPMIAAYYLLAQDKLTHKGGFWFYAIILVFGIAFVVALVKVLKKQKAGLIKATFRWATKLGVLLIFMFIFRYIDYNLKNLLTVLYITIGGFFLGYLVEVLLVTHYKDYIRELEVF